MLFEREARFLAASLEAAMEAVSGLGNDDDSSVLISTEGRQRRGGGRRRKARRSKGGEGGATTQLTVHSHGLKSKQPTNTLQVAAGQGQ